MGKKSKEIYISRKRKEKKKIAALECGSIFQRWRRALAVLASSLCFWATAWVDSSLWVQWRLKWRLPLPLAHGSTRLDSTRLSTISPSHLAFPPRAPAQFAVVGSARWTRSSVAAPGVLRLLRLSTLSSARRARITYFLQHQHTPTLSFIHSYPLW